MAYTPNYPATVVEVLDPPVQFRQSVILAVRRFASSKPYRGTDEDRRAKFASLHGDLCAIYAKNTRLYFGSLRGGDSGASHYSPTTDEITLVGRLSVVTYLHEYAHALGRDERGAVRWSANLFRACFPRSFARCVMVGHMLRHIGPPAPDRPELTCPTSRSLKTVTAQALDRQPLVQIGEVTSVTDSGTIVVLWTTSAEGRAVPAYFDRRLFQWLLDAEGCTAAELVGRHAAYDGGTVRLVD